MRGTVMKELLERLESLEEAADRDWNKPIVKSDFKGKTAFITILVGTMIETWKKTFESRSDVTKEIAGLKSIIGKIKRSTAEKASDAVSDFMYDDNPYDDWDFEIDFKNRNRELSNLQWERKQVGEEKLVGELVTWFREYLPKYIDDWYDAMKKGRLKREPCITASFVADDFDAGGHIPHKYRDAYKGLLRKKQVSKIRSALESLRKKGKIGSSLGGSGRRETRCYEPKDYP